MVFCIARDSSTINRVNSEGTINFHFVLECAQVVFRPGAGTADAVVEFELQFQDLVLLLQEEKGIEFGETGEDELPRGTHFAGLVQELFVGVRDEVGFKRGFIYLDIIFVLIKGCSCAHFEVTGLDINRDFGTDGGSGHCEVSRIATVGI